MLVRYGKKIYGRYGFVDAFNPSTQWVSRDVIGIDLGITLLSAENLRTGSVWSWFMSNPEAERALDLVGLRRESPLPLPQMSKTNRRNAGTKTRRVSFQVTATNEIVISHDVDIPASSFEFRIPLPLPALQSR